MALNFAAILRYFQVICNTRRLLTSTAKITTGKGEKAKGMKKEYIEKIYAG